MKRFIWQFGLLISLSLIIGISFNSFSDSPLPLFKKFIPDPGSQIEVDQSLHFEEIDAEILKSIKLSPDTILLDARLPLEYLQSHIPGAISLPISQFTLEYESVKPLIKEGMLIVTYCSDPTCADSTMLAVNLSRKGHKSIFIYKGGMEDWIQMGHLTEPPPE